MWTLPVFALHSGITDAKGDCAFSEEFIRDYDQAQKLVDELKSAEPLIKLTEKYQQEQEQAELELSIGLAYNQRTGVVDPAKAVVHLSNALKFQLPERTQIKIFMWRGNSLEGLKKHEEALQDYLRGLLACSYHDLSGEWPEIKPSDVPIYMNSDDPKNEQRVRDYQRYRRSIDFQRFLFMQRHYLIEAVKRVQVDAAIDEAQIRRILKGLTPDESRYDVVLGSIKSKNERPWP
ncbi:hypothetical protein [Coraliomargarita parva]|uniref:hypothetical protein n=1 Tax=Coraliomargarita parva TaxID=3014050 RepID=UPI0022B5BDA5|nr:hypothetical protein [Coraliomargarita parva]